MQNKIPKFTPKINKISNQFLTRTMTQSNLKQNCDDKNKKSVFENLYQIA